MSDSTSPFELFDELRIIAHNGLAYADDPYDRERYERLEELTSEWYGRTLEIDPETVSERFRTELGHITPKVSADAAIINEDGELLLQRRIDDDSWCLPGGYTEPGESPADTAVREANEETGLVVHTESLATVYTRRPAEHTGPHGLVGHVYLCSVTGGELSVSHEGSALAYRDPSSVDLWHANHKTLATDALAAANANRR
ncbi:NUDIX hydrolase N-terminal domain-containing protein [Halocatena halophila]|uniref:NUDIX hydrolase N-terminal domain-containing protein n=1 Tax=Halocatena halophila TaxID=2814576 RepID=UPI002ED2CA7E